jgi:predicted component of type VI protein secretion system
MQQQPQRHRDGAETARAIRAFLATYDGRVTTWQVAMRIRERLHSELYRREREHYPEWIDHGGEA